MNHREGLAWLEQQAIEHEHAAREIRRAIERLRQPTTPDRHEPAPRRAPRGADDGLTAVVLRIIEASSEPMTSSTVWRSIISNGTRISTTSGDPSKMVNSTLRQLVARGAIIKTDRGYAKRPAADAAPSEGATT